MNIDDRQPTNDQRPTDLRAHSHILQKFQNAITLQRVSRSPSCLVLGWGFRGRQIERRHFRLDQIQDGGRRPSWKTSNGQISETYYLIHCKHVYTIQTILCPRALICNDGDSKLMSQARVSSWPTV